jgi:hypothetical protein
VVIRRFVLQAEEEKFFSWLVILYIVFLPAREATDIQGFRNRGAPAGRLHFFEVARAFFLVEHARDLFSDAFFLGRAGFFIQFGRTTGGRCFFPHGGGSSTVGRDIFFIFASWSPRASGAGAG